MPIQRQLKIFHSTKTIHIEICDSFFTKLKGLMFRKTIKDDSGILLVQDKENKIDSSIHMFFMNFDIAVFWLDHKNTVVDKTIAKKWRPFYAPKKDAKSVLETHTANFSLFQIGDIINFESH